MRFSYDAFVLNNKKDAIYYSGPFAASERNLVLNSGEVVVVDAFNYTTSVASATVSGTTGKPTASISGGAVTITGGSATGDYTVTLSDGAQTAHTTVINVKVV